MFHMNISQSFHNLQSLEWSVYINGEVNCHITK